MQSKIQQWVKWQLIEIKQLQQQLSSVILWSHGIGCSLDEEKLFWHTEMKYFALWSVLGHFSTQNKMIKSSLCNKNTFKQIKFDGQCNNKAAIPNCSSVSFYKYPFNSTWQ